MFESIGKDLSATKEEPGVKENGVEDDHIFYYIDDEKDTEGDDLTEVEIDEDESEFLDDRYP